MSELQVERLSYLWRGEWSPGTEYKRDDVVSLNGKSYVCLIGHISDSIFFNDLNAVVPGSTPPIVNPKWVLMTAGITFRNTWETGIEYNRRELVYYKGSVYNCITAHVSNQFSQDRNNWEFFAFHIDYIGNWQSSQEYADGSVVRYNGVNYKCIEPHQSQSRLEDDSEKWNEFFIGIKYRGDWQPNKEFRKNDLVKFGASVYRCIETHNSGFNEFDSNKFEIEFPGFQFESEWNPTEQYQQGDVVSSGGTLYVALVKNTGVPPFQSLSDSTPAWVKFGNFYRFRGTHNLGTEYRTGDIVQRGGQLWVALSDIDANGIEGTLQDYLDPDLWELLVPGSSFSKNWEEERNYSVGEVVYFKGTAFRCNFEHISSEENFPGDNGNAFDFWDIFIQGSPAGLRERGDLLTFGLSRPLADDLSTVGDVRVPIGEEEQFLSVDETFSDIEDEEDLEVFWRHREQDSDVIYVGLNGVDDPEFDINRGLVKEKPFRTLEFASSYVVDNFEPGTLVSIKVATGTYEEIAPIIVPAGCVIFGQELRSTTIMANKPLPEYEDDFQFVQIYLEHLTTVILDILQNNPIQPSPGNDIEQNLDTATTDNQGVNVIFNQIQEFVDYVEFRIADGDRDPELFGSNDPNPNTLEVEAAQALWDNRKFIATELWAFIQNQNPQRTFTRIRVVNDVIALIRGVVKDLEFSSNYFTLLAAERYVNAVTGSQDGDLFRMRDTTGLRLLTVTGLEGEVFEITPERRYPVVTGGAYVALDPGWGPEDERTWIKNRSPYIQNVTTIGTGCVGKRVDGRLHNGGNRSMVSNDFTQVLSDGIGAWVSHGGRSELVSVFTYFNAIGYLAEDGGIIRATNGNNSYGRFGTVAAGTDPSEIPSSASVFNRNNEAQVDEAIAGGPVDEIIALEYSNAGQNYTQAEAVVIGAGQFVETSFNDFRDNACFESRVTIGEDSGAPGGSNYLIAQGFAQVTEDSASTIKLSATDQTQLDTDYIGQRILIVGGLGTGQYARISAYNPDTKEATVRRESDSELGWDHIISGTPILDSIDSTARYRIEPRVVTSHPGFTSTNTDLPAGRTFIESVYGETVEVYTDIELGQGTALNPGGVFEPALLNVTKKAREYEVEIVDGGAGYAAGDTFVIPGDQLGGSSPDNDLFIDVVQVTNDSTNSIIDIASEGTGRKGRIVALAEPNFVIYSQDGETWQESTLSFVGDYRDVVAGNNRFVAVAANEDRVSLSLDGITWETINLPRFHTWSSSAFGNGRFVIIASNSNDVVYSDDGKNWFVTDIPDDTGEFQDSTISSYTKVVYGKGKFVAVSTSDRATATSIDGINWVRHNEALPAELNIAFDDFADLAYGDNKFILLNKDGIVYYSFDGINWLEGTPAPNSENIEWDSFKYSQGVFFAIGKNTNIQETDFVATTENGLLWRSNNLLISQNYASFATATFEDTPKWYVFANDSTQNGVAVVKTGKQAFFRASVFQRSIDLIKIIDPGSGYTDENPLEVTVEDSNVTVDVQLQNRIGSGVLSQPDYVNRGVGYVRGSSEVNISGDGFADIIPDGRTVTLSGVSNVPRVGSQIIFDSIVNDINNEEPKAFVITTVTDLGDDGTRQGTRLVKFDLRIDIRVSDNLEHNTPAIIRTKVSQARITGHDFLDIGTGNEVETDYPDIYAAGNFFRASPENEVLEVAGGRVFYVSTDQDGNFRGGDLFAVEQATGVITISADFFDLRGLTELSLGGIRLGGSGTIVREFSTDATFTQDSDNVVSTQRAISGFLADRLSIGGENLETNLLTAGRVRVGGPDNVIETITGEPVDVNALIIHEGKDELGNSSGVGGTMISQQLFLRTFNDSIQ